MAFGSGNNSNSKQSTTSSMTSSSHHRHHHSSGSHHHNHHHHQSSAPPPTTSSSQLQPQQQQSKSSNINTSSATPAVVTTSSSTHYTNALGYYPSDISNSSSAHHPVPPHHAQNHLFFQQSNSSFSKQSSKQSFQHGSGSSGVFSDGMVDDRGFLGGNQGSSSSAQQQQYNHNLFLQHHHHPRDLTPSERLLLDQIRARKSELLNEIAQLQDEIDNVSRELIYNGKDDDVGKLREQPPLADVELDNLSEHSNNDEVIVGSNKVPSGSLLGSNNSSSSNASSKEKDRLKLMSLGCKKFNMDPKKGIEFLVTNSLLKKDDEQDISMFLYRGEGLNKTAIGDYLGERNDVNEKVLKAFVALHDFTDLILVQALRQFLWSFRLPGEAQKIDRMMECFAQRYCQNNPDIFTNTDTCYVLSFAIIMLNTSLHNPSVKDKPTVDTFISMNRGINNGGDLPRELLISLYNSIQSEPFKIPEDDGNDLMHTFFNPDKEGWLWKQGGRYKTWKRRWFILNDNCLYYFEFTTDKEPRGIIPLENVGVREIEDSKSKQKYCFELYATDGSEVIKACKTDSDGRVVEGKHSVYRMSAASSEERDSWVKALRQSISYSPFYEILRKSGGGGGGNSTSSLRGVVATSGKPL